MDLEQITTFVNLAQYKNFSKTAVKMHITQPAVSQRLKSLEDELEQKLIERKGKTLHLTPAGQYFYNNMVHIVDSIDNTIRTVKEFSSPSEISIGVSPFGGKYILPKILPKIHDKFNNVRINIRTVAQPNQLIELFAKGIVDYIIFTIYKLPKELNYELLWNEPIILVSNPDHPITKINDIHMDDITKYPIVSLSSDKESYHFHHELMTISKEKEIKLNVQTLTDNIEIAKQIVKTEPLISFLPELCVKDEIDQGSLIKLQNPFRLFQSVYFLSRNQSDFFFKFKHLLNNFALQRQQEIKSFTAMD